MKCGMGNWVDIAEQYVKTKDPKQCEDHYFSFYYKAQDNFLPNHDDCIMKSQRIVKNDLIVFDIDENKAAQAQYRVGDY